jgi:Mitochondrial ATP synthase B chain precursor (ATP-synt_B)
MLIERCMCISADHPPSIQEWAEHHIARIKSVLNGARDEHTQAVKVRLDSIDQMKEVVSLTEGLCHFQGPLVLVYSPSWLIIPYLCVS